MRKSRRVQDGGGGATKERDAMSRNNQSILDAEVLDEEYGYVNRKPLARMLLSMHLTRVLNLIRSTIGENPQ